MYTDPGKSNPGSGDFFLGGGGILSEHSGQLLVGVHDRVVDDLLVEGEAAVLLFTEHQRAQVLHKPKR